MKTNIKQLRILRGYTQAQLAALVDVSESAISQYESGKKIPSTETLYKLGEALDCPVSDILDDRKSVEFSLSTLEREFIRKYRSLDKHGKSIVDFVLNEEAARCDVISLDDFTMVARSGKKMNEATKADAQKMAEIVFGDEE
jgi:transcriptional regulator with XRE-family HTH domain